MKKHSSKIAYIDLFAGPGRYKDGSSSTPIKVLETAIAREDMASKLVTLFNDVDSDHVESLKRAIGEIEGIDKLAYTPIIHNNEVGNKIVGMFEEINLIPTLFFVDPWEYKGLSLRLINSVLKNWGCDCIFFFNYNRINMGISNIKVVEHMNALFGEERAEKLRVKVKGLKPFDREMTVVNELALALGEMGGKYVLPFCFKNENGQRTSHHLVFVSKD